MLKLFWLLLIMVFISFFNSALSQEGTKNIKINKNIELIAIKDSVFVVSTWFDSEQFGRFSSNGLLFIKNSKAILIDTPNDNEQTSQLYSYVKDSMHVSIQKVIICHYHSDCLGGLEFIKQQGIESISLDLTKKICVGQKLPVPAKTFSEKLSFKFEGDEVICQYFGPGHTVDNTIVYFPKTKILYGGCLIKSMSATGMGNVADAVPDKWTPTVEKLQKTYKNIDYVVPGHGDFGNADLLKHTLSLIAAFNGKKKQ